MSKLAYLDGCLRDSHIYKMQQERFEIFKSQDPENGHFDVTFEIGGKRLFANKIFLTSVSETLKAMLSDRWSNKDEAVKIEAYSYDNFYQFLCFLYSGYCELTPHNVFQLTDMAEFYAVPFLKEFCEKFLMKMEYNIESIEEMFDFSQKYSVSNMKQELKRYIRSNIGEVTSTERLLSYKKPFVDFLFSTDSDKGKHFEAVYKWTEHQVLEQHDPEDKSFNLLEAVKAELRETFPQIFSIDGIWWEYDFKTRMEYDFLMNFVIEKGFFFSPFEFNIYIDEHCDLVQTTFEQVYNLAEKQALQKQKMSSDAETFNIADCIKADLIEVIPNASFNRMEKSFLMNFVVAKGIITEEQANHVSDTRIRIENNGKIIFGVFKDDNIGIHHMFDNHESWFKIKRQSTNKIRFIKAVFSIPSTPSTVKKMKGVDWYLCLEVDGVLTFKQKACVTSSDYILAEMKSQNKFTLTAGAMTQLTVSFNNVQPIL